MKRIVSSVVISCILLFGLTGTSAAISTVPWYQPAGLSAGEKYQLIFATSSITDGFHSDLDYWMQFVNDAAANNSDLMPLTWRPIISHADWDARNVAYVFGPVYNLNKEIIANSYTDMWDGTIDNPIKYNEYLDAIAYEVWTGSNPDGTGYQGRTVGNIAFPIIGLADDQTSNWICDPDENRGTESSWLHVYALSDPIAAVPIPGAVWVLGTGIGFLGLVRRKIKR